MLAEAADLRRAGGGVGGRRRGARSADNRRPHAAAPGWWCGCGPTSPTLAGRVGTRRPAGRCSTAATRRPRLRARCTPSAGPLRGAGRPGRRRGPAHARRGGRPGAWPPRGRVARRIGGGGPMREVRVELGRPVLPGAGRGRRPPPAAEVLPVGARGRPSSPRTRFPSTVDSGIEQRDVPSRRRRGGQEPRDGRGAVPGLGPLGPHPGRRGRGRRRRRGHRHGRLRGRRVPPGDRRRPRAHHPARPGGRRHRRQDRASTCPRARIWSGRSGSRPRCSATPRRC